MAESLMQGNAEALVNLRDTLSKRDALRKKLINDNKELEELGKKYRATEKDISEDIEDTIKKKKKELLSDFDKKKGSVLSEKKDIEQRKNKQKEKEVAARVGDETEFLVKENKEIRKDIMRYLKENHVPKAFRNSYFDVLYMPIGLVERLWLFAAMLIFLVLCPVIIMFIGQSTGFYDELNAANQKVFIIVLIALWEIIVLALYFIIYAKVKMRYIDVFTQTKELRKSIHSNEKKINDIKKSIRSDKDESRYNLDSFNKELSLADEKAEAINFDRNIAIHEFEEKTVGEIREDITKKRTPELEKIKEETAEKEASIKETEEKIKELTESLDKASEELGNEMMDSDKLEKLILIMESGEASTVSDAVSVLKGRE